MRWIPFFPTKRHLIRLTALGTFSSKEKARVVPPAG
jgi:hypothetical protein